MRNNGLGLSVKESKKLESRKSAETDHDLFGGQPCG